MDKRWLRVGGWALLWMVGCALWWWGGQPAATASSDKWTIPPTAPQLSNPGFECGVGYYNAGKSADGQDILVPNGWNLIVALGSPNVSSTRRFYTGDCNASSPAFIEKLNGIDSLLVRSQDIETLPAPGKPFDVYLYHRVPALVDGAYSLSAWMTSKCGNTNPVDCPAGTYIVKAVGIDPNGGTDPTAKEIEWVESRANLRWQNLRTSATALNETITVFARMYSPFQFHGNLGFMDEFSLVRAPLSALEELPKKVENTGKVVLSWFGKESEDIRAIPAGTHQMLFDVQARSLPNGAWQDVVVGATTQMSTTFQAPCVDISYEFRVRARAEQPDDVEGASPNHRYPGVWSKPQTVLFTAPAAPITPTVVITPNLFIPLAGHLMKETGC